MEGSIAPKRQPLHWERGRPARTRARQRDLLWFALRFITPHNARAGAVARQLWRAQLHRSVNLFTGTAGVPPAASASARLAVARTPLHNTSQRARRGSSPTLMEGSGQRQPLHWDRGRPARTRARQRELLW
jgi:hypothetical protein